MSRILVVCTLWLCTIQTPSALAQTRDPRVDQLTKDMEELKHTVADQDKRISDLEKTVKMLQALMNPAPAPIPAVNPPWTSSSNWTRVKAGMSEADVTEILGSPTSVQSVVDSKILFYQSDAKSSSALKGSVTLMDDRVTAMSPPAF